ncbi:MAG: helix-turn-helix domain-containing protein [Nitrospirae bacterium]|nr:helix-turn-helix domain-containing protein [Nitrospirota bacterium]MBF0535900.1 helix-turn-helix domain-containing protein [Nitrospirota bacterium]MBF0617767.1 helix-turn-helix domain-containing protein [Nitrospirota bacterium]
MIGDYLKKLREENGVSLEEISSRTNIKISYLSALEYEDYSALPSELYIRGFITSYVKSLELDPAEAVSIYTGNGGNGKKPRKKAQLPQCVKPLKFQLDDVKSTSKSKTYFFLTITLLIVLSVILVPIILNSKLIK